MGAARIDDFEELASREADGVQVALLWARLDGTLKVLVVDARLGELLELAAEAHDALDIFNHPYAYAAFREIDPQPLFGDEDREPAFAEAA